MYFFIAIFFLSISCLVQSYFQVQPRRNFNFFIFFKCIEKPKQVTSELTKQKEKKIVTFRILSKRTTIFA